MQRNLIIALVLCAVASLAEAQTLLDCTGTYFRSTQVPAVADGGGGQIVNVSLEAKPGDGTAFIATGPIVGGMTQESGSLAMEVATGIAGYNRSTCDFLFKIGSKELSSIDGPSAGATMTLLILAALKNETIRNDLMITGTIEPGGAIGPVGGIPEKAEALSNAGYKVFLVPRLSPEDRITLDALGGKLKLRILQVDTAVQAEGLATGITSVENFKNPRLVAGEVPNVTAISSLSSEKFSVFRKIAESISSSGRSSLSRIPSDNEEYVSYLGSELDIAENAISKGYLYSGANTAFITNINSEFLSFSQSPREEIKRISDDVDGCFSRASRARLTEKNFEWVIGAQVRASWAKNKIVKIKSTSIQTEVSALENLREALYAEKWCEASDELVSAQGGGRELPQSLLKSAASKAIAEAEDYLSGKGSEFGDEAWHLETAKQEFEDGLYAASLYDSAYAEFMAKGYDDFSSSQNASQLVASQDGRQYDGIWASLYYSQFQYMRSLGDSGRTSLRLAEFSESLENRTAMIRGAFGGVAIAEERGESDFAGYLVVGLMVCTLASLIYVFEKSSERKKGGEVTSGPIAAEEKAILKPEPKAAAKKTKKTPKGK